VRERQILRLVAQGWTNREIATELGLSRGNVKNHVSHLLEKLDVSDRTQAAAQAVRLGLLEAT
jgi:DNA-binding NarL/FixJ family response regulator